MNILMDYMAVQVVERHPNGHLKTWYNGEMRGTLAEAKADADANAQEFPGTEYQVLKRTFKEIGTPRIEVPARATR